MFMLNEDRMPKTPSSDSVHADFGAMQGSIQERLLRFRSQTEGYYKQPQNSKDPTMAETLNEEINETEKDRCERLSFAAIHARLEKLQQENMKLSQQTQLFAEKNSKLTKQHERDMDKLIKMEHNLERKGTELQKLKEDIDRKNTMAYYHGGKHALLAIKNMVLQDTEQALFAIKNMELQILEQKSEDVKAQTGVDKESLHHYRNDRSGKENLNNIASLETKNSKKRKRKKALDIRKSSYKIATNIQRFRKLHLRGDNNLCEDTCNGAEYLNLCPEGNKRPDDFDDLADFIVCKKQKDYSKWFKDRESCRWKYQNTPDRKKKRSKKLMTCLNSVRNW